MLNRISRENARLILPLEPTLRGAEAGDCPPWWAARCAELWDMEGVKSIIGIYIRITYIQNHPDNNLVLGSFLLQHDVTSMFPRLLTSSHVSSTASHLWLERGNLVPATGAALMLNHYIQVIHTNRCARGLAMRSADNVLPEYLDAVAGPNLRFLADILPRNRKRLQNK